MIGRLAIIGVGLIGGSLSLALKKAGMVKEVIGYSRTEQIHQQAVNLGVIDKSAASIAEAVRDADIIFIAVPIASMSSILVEIAESVRDGTIITDGCSVKVHVVTAAKHALGNNFSRFIPGHPIAGTEHRGTKAAYASLYQNHRVILTPVKQTNSRALSIVRSMWQATGAEVSDMEAEYHDIVLAATSHLPHVLAFNLVGMLAECDNCDDILQYAAGGFRDFSRIVSSDAVMWRDICLSNKDAILGLLRQYHQDLRKIEEAIKEEDCDFLIDVFGRAKQARDVRFNGNIN